MRARTTHFWTWGVLALAVAFIGSSLWMMRAVHQFRARIAASVGLISQLTRVEETLHEAASLLPRRGQPDSTPSAQRWRALRAGLSASTAAIQTDDSEAGGPGNIAARIDTVLSRLDRLHAECCAAFDAAADTAALDTAYAADLQAAIDFTRASARDIRRLQSETSAELGRYWQLLNILLVVACTGMIMLVLTVAFYQRNLVNLRRAEAVRDGQNRVLELLATGPALNEVIELLIATSERQNPHLRCAVCALDESTQRLRLLAAPSFAAEYRAAAADLPIGPDARTCGAAVYHRRHIIVEDVQSDPGWADARELAERHEIRAGWSQPILSQDGRVLGAFAGYYRTRRVPDAADLDLAESGAHLAGIAIQRWRDMEAIRRARTELEARVDERTSELQTANESLRTEMAERRKAQQLNELQQEKLARVARLGAMGAMAAGLAHELNQPLTAVSSYAAGCLRMIEAGGYDRAELVGYLQKAGGEARRAGEILRRIRSFIEDREQTRTSVDLNSLARESLNLLAREIEQAGVQPRLNLAADLPPVQVDGIQIQQVMLNLISNALDALRQTGAAQKRIEITTACTDSAGVEVRVRDTGCGIPADAAKEVFYPFYTTKSGGQGLGLAISRSIIENHGGTLSVDAAVSPGAAFVIRLPLNGSAARRAE